MLKNLQSSRCAPWIGATAVAVSALAPALFAQHRPGGRDTGPCKIYTDAEDFALGNLFNLDVVDVDGDTCLRLTDEVKTWPFIGVANSSRGTISRIAVDNSVAGFSEGDVVGEYLTSPAGLTSVGGQPSPSRTTVDSYGNIWVGNREETGFIGAQQHGSVARIGLVIGGTRGKIDGSGNFVVDPTGDYLQGPFTYNTCEDRDNDGLIKTSRGYAHVTGTSDYVATHLPWSNAGIAYNGGVTQAEDECITAYVRTAGFGVRFVSIDPFGDVWTGGNYSSPNQPKKFEKIDGDTAQVVSGSATPVNCGGYGGLVDKENILWSASQVLRWDIGNAGPPTCLPIAAYGVGIDPQTNHIWTSNGNNIQEIDRNGVLLNTYPNGNTVGLTQGIVVDRFSNVWSAHSIIGGTQKTVGHNRTTGLHVGNVDLTVNPPLAPAAGPTGVAFDSNDKVWSTNYYSHNTMRIDPNAGPIGNGGFNIGEVDLVVDLGQGSNPYNYSDMTGSVLVQAVAPQGSWTFIHDGGETGCPWGELSWTSVEGPGTSIEVRVRASDSPIPSGPWTTVSNGVPFTGVTGQYLQVQITLHRTAKTPGEVLLCDVTICKEATCSADVESIVCDVEDDGSVDVTLEVFNNSGLDAEHILFTPMPPGSSVTITPNVLAQSIPNGGSANVTVTISGLTPGEPFCFMVTLLDESMQQCCSFEVCIDPDCECLQVHPGSESIECDPATGEYSYTFQFDNLTTDTLHHAYFFAPSGVTISPNYTPLSPPVLPGQTSPPIKVTIAGPNAVPGAEICFVLSIHDFFLNECCSREICITLPSCESDPDPDLPDDCHLTAVAACCPNQQTTTTVLTICNNTAGSRTFDWSIAALDECDFLPDGAISPNMGTTPPVAPGQCVNIPITIQCGELGADGTPGATACLSATVINAATGEACKTEGLIRKFDQPAPDWCFEVVGVGAGPGVFMKIPGVVDLDMQQTAMVDFHVENVGKANQLTHAFSATSPFISLNGFFGGQTPNEYLEFGPGASAILPLDARFLQPFEVGAIHDVFLLADLGGTLMPVASAGIRFVEDGGLASCPGDLTADDQVGVPDLLQLLAAWGQCPEGIPGSGPNSTCPADFNGDGSVGVPDLLFLLANWGARS